jgi:HEPN domain-containing protein
MLTRPDLQKLAHMRLVEASVLLDQGHFSGAYYLGGYAGELALKAVIAKNFVGDEIPDRSFVNSIYTHVLATLVDKAGLKPDLDNRQKTDDKFATNWEIVKNWNEASRYEVISEDDARGLIEALSDPESGVLIWIRAYW